MEKILKNKRKLKNIKRIQIDNIDRLLNQSTKLDILKEKASELKWRAKNFSKKAKKLKKREERAEKRLEAATHATFFILFVCGGIALTNFLIMSGCTGICIIHALCGIFFGIITLALIFDLLFASSTTLGFLHYIVRLDTLNPIHHLNKANNQNHSFFDYFDNANHSPSSNDFTDPSDLNDLNDLNNTDYSLYSNYKSKKPRRSSYFNYVNNTQNSEIFISDNAPDNHSVKHIKPKPALFYDRSELRSEPAAETTAGFTPESTPKTTPKPALFVQKKKKTNKSVHSSFSFSALKAYVSNKKSASISSYKRSGKSSRNMNSYSFPK